MFFLALIVAGLPIGLLLSRVLKRLYVFQDEWLANRIIEAERIKTAEARLELYDSDDSKELHMCITTACRNPVVGRWIFAHCEQHLTSYERRWLEEKIEDGGVTRPLADDSVHPLAKDFQEAIKSRDKELVIQNASKKDAALAEARDLLEKARSQQRERDNYLPRQLLRRVEEARERAEQAYR
jgi:hypothetical protein